MNIYVAIAVGDWGVVESPLRPSGKAKFGEHYIEVVTEGVFVAPGEQIRVIAFRDNNWIVRPIEETA